MRLCSRLWVLWGLVSSKKGEELKKPCEVSALGQPTPSAKARLFMKLAWVVRVW